MGTALPESESVLECFTGLIVALRPLACLQPLHVLFEELLDQMLADFDALVLVLFLLTGVCPPSPRSHLGALPVSQLAGLGGKVVLNSSVDERALNLVKNHGVLQVRLRKVEGGVMVKRLLVLISLQLVNRHFKLLLEAFRSEAPLKEASLAAASVESLGEFCYEFYQEFDLDYYFGLRLDHRRLVGAHQMVWVDCWLVFRAEFEVLLVDLGY